MAVQKGGIVTGCQGVVKLSKCIGNSGGRACGGPISSLPLDGTQPGFQLCDGLRMGGWFCTFAFPFAQGLLTEALVVVLMKRLFHDARGDADGRI